MSLIADLILAGVDPDLVARVADELSAARALGRSEATPTRTPRQERNARYYSKASEKRLNASYSDVSAHTSLPPKESPPTPPKEITPIPSSSLRSDENNRCRPRKTDIREILETCLEPEVAAGVIEHRQRLRKPLTAMAAQGLANAFAATGDPNAAARMMVERGWQGFRPDWFTNDRQGTQTGRPPPRAGPTTGELLLEAMQGKFTEGLVRDGIVTGKD